MTRTGEPAPRLLAEICVPTAARMRWLGRRLAALLRPGDLIVLNGQLGAGKTTLVQGIGDGLDVRGPVTSPTFVIARIHPALRGGPALVHVDAYRLSSPAEVDDLDLDADLDSSVTVVEWGGGLAEGLAPSWLEVTISLPRHGTAGRAGDGGPGNAGSEPGDGDGGPGEATGGASGAEAVLIAEGISGAGTGLAAGGGSDGGPGLAAGGFSDPGDEPRAVRLAGRGPRWAAAAESVHLAQLGAAEVL